MTDSTLLVQILLPRELCGDCPTYRLQHRKLRWLSSLDVSCWHRQFPPRALDRQSMTLEIPPGRGELLIILLGRDAGTTDVSRDLP